MIQKKEKVPFTKGSMIVYFMEGSTHLFVISILCAFLVTLLEMLIPQVIRFTIDNVIGSEKASLPGFIQGWIDAAGGQDFLREHLLVISGLILLLAAIAVIARYIFNLYNNKGAETLMQTMRERLFAHIQRLPFEWHQQNKTGDIIQRCTSDTDHVKIFVSEQLTSIVRIVLMLVLAVVFMFSMNWKLALIALVCVPIVLGYSMYFEGKFEAKFEECDENEGILSTIAQENLTGVRVVRAFGREKFEQQRFKKQSDFYADLWVGLLRLMAMFWGSSDLISYLQVMLMLIVGMIFCVRGEMTVGTFIAFMSYNGWLTWPVRQLGRVISEMSKAGVSIDRIMYIMNSPEEKDDPDALEADMSGDIVFDHVNFSYTDVPVLEDISFTIPAGSTFGIIGGTGSGKSTLMLLLDRLYPLKKEEGRITIGGVDLAKIKASWVRSHIGMVLQEPFLFSKTIKENIGITDDNMILDEIREFTKIACVDDAISGFSKGYDTIVGERGVTLSGGQKQRVAIARMLSQKAPIMIFDDSLSAVDTETDEKIRHALAETQKNATTILISHRMTTLSQADQIMVLDHGRIAEIGTPQELYENNGIYRHIYDMQMGLGEEVRA